MADERKAGSMILSQLGMFNEAVILYGNVVEPTILKAIDKSIENFTDENNWEGEFDLAGDDNDCWLYPAEWNIAGPGEEPAPKARFSIDCINGDDDYWAALFCRQGSTGGEAGFIFDVDPTKFNGRRAWNTYTTTIDPVLIATLDRAGFNALGRGKFFLPVHLDANLLASAWETYGEEEISEFAMDDSLKPLTIALETLKRSCETFEKIMSDFSVKTIKKTSKQ